MSSVWSASMSNGTSDLACHMCLSADTLTGRRPCADCTGGKQLNKQEQTGESRDLDFMLTTDASKHTAIFTIITHQTLTMCIIMEVPQ